jgi:hypothetical protein
MMDEHIHYGLPPIHRKRRYFRKVSVDYHITQSSLIFLHDVTRLILHLADYVWYSAIDIQSRMKSLDDL